MKHSIKFLTGCLILGLTPAAAFADCKAALAALEAGTVPHTGGIAKDGTLAPLQDSGTVGPKVEPHPDMGTVSADHGSSPAKDGAGLPLGVSPAQAMSGADAQAQQGGAPTAAEESRGAARPANARDAAITTAREALAAGNESACLNALQAAAAFK